tara:strand:+ start:1679 stop:1816 length:138 start_codon:yes stop_codon:yes gene_type:complete
MTKDLTQHGGRVSLEATKLLTKPSEVTTPSKLTIGDDLLKAGYLL